MRASILLFSAEDPTQAATDPDPVRAAPEDTSAALTEKEFFVISDHARRNPAPHRAWRHDIELSVALHAAGLSSAELEAFSNEPKLLLEREVRNFEELHAPVSHRLVFEEATVAGQEHAPLFQRLPRKGPVREIGPLAGVVRVVAGGAQPLRQAPEQRIAEKPRYPVNQ
jgi:hypothetical protein